MGIISLILEAIFPPSLSEEKLLDQRFAESLPIARLHRERFITAVFDYREPFVRDLIKIFKTRYSIRLAKLYSRFMWEELERFMADKYFFEDLTELVLIPIPVTRKRLRERGFNQSELLAEYISKHSGIPVMRNVLIKIKDTGKQASISNRTKRLANIVGCYGIRKSENIKYKNVVLVDDVSTTGATLIEARKILKHFGAKNIYAITLAH